MKHFDADAIVIGGGFYGCVIACYLKRERGFGKVVLVEREDKLLCRASTNNQARIHNGYHYPRSHTTAFRSRVNYPRFVRDWPSATYSDFAQLYAIARRNSKVTSKQFERFCRDIGAKISKVDTNLRQLFEYRLIDEVFLVEEASFDASILANHVLNFLLTSGVEIRYRSHANSIFSISDNGLQVNISSTDLTESITSPFVFNCTYSQLNQFDGDFKGTDTRLKHEIAELGLIELPDNLSGIGVTVMDGPFFSFMPFPSRSLHTLTHVRYTPHFSWNDKTSCDPYSNLQSYNKSSRVDRMIRDAARYIPSLLNSKHIDSLYEVKTVLVNNEIDDGRPILFESHKYLTGLYSVLGSKIDNVYDVIEKLDTLNFDKVAHK